MRPSEIPSWSAWMIARTKLAISCEELRSDIFLSASLRPSPMRIPPSASSNSSISGPSMCSVSFCTAPSNPSPASTLTESRSSASGSSADTATWRDERRLIGHVGLKPRVTGAKGTRALLQEVGLEPDERQPRAAGREDRRQLEAKAPRRACDEDSLPGEARPSQREGHRRVSSPLRRRTAPRAPGRGGSGHRGAPLSRRG